MIEDLQNNNSELCLFLYKKLIQFSKREELYFSENPDILDVLIKPDNSFFHNNRENKPLPSTKRMSKKDMIKFINSESEKKINILKESKSNSNNSKKESIIQAYQRDLKEIFVKCNLGLSQNFQFSNKFNNAIYILEDIQNDYELSINQKKLVAEHLEKIYKKLGEKAESKGQVKEALQFFEKCLTACSNSLNKSLEAEITMKLADVYIKMGKFMEAEHKIEDFKTHCINSLDRYAKHNEMNYARLLTECHLKKGELDDAKINAKKYFELANELSSEFLESKAKAALKLSDVLWKKKIFQKEAIGFYDSYFTLCKQNVSS